MTLPLEALIVHFSDTHLIEGPGLLYGAADSENHLRGILNQLESSGMKPDAFVFTGDIADQGEAGAYDKVRAIVEPVAERMGVEVVWVMGNHDNRSNMRESLLEGERSLPFQKTAPVDYVKILKSGLHLIVLDTSVPNHHYGNLDAGQLAWLDDRITDAGDAGAIIALHHPPLPSPQELAVTTQLRNLTALANVVRGRNVKAFIGGHMHHSCFGMFAGVPVSVSAATCYTQDLTVPVGSIRGMDGGQSFNLVHVYKETVTHTVVPYGNYRTVGQPLSVQQVDELIAFSANEADEHKTDIPTVISETRAPATESLAVIVQNP